MTQEEINPDLQSLADTHASSQKEYTAVITPITERTKEQAELASIVQARYDARKKKYANLIPSKKKELEVRQQKRIERANKYAYTVDERQAYLMNADERSPYLQGLYNKVHYRNRYEQSLSDSSYNRLKGALIPLVKTRAESDAVLTDWSKQPESMRALTRALLHKFKTATITGDKVATLNPALNPNLKATLERISDGREVSVASLPCTKPKSRVERQADRQSSWAGMDYSYEAKPKGVYTSSGESLLIPGKTPIRTLN